MDYSKIGHRLKLVRDRKGLSYEQVFEITRIQPSILEDIEEGRASISPVFLKGFIKTYALFLGLDVQELFKEIKEENEKDNNSVKKNEENNKDDKKERSYLKYILPLLGLFIIFQISIWILNSSKKDMTRTEMEDYLGRKSVKHESVQNIKGTKKNITHEDQNVETQNTAVESAQAGLPENQTLFHQIKNAAFIKDILIKSSEPLEVYFKVDQKSTFTKTLQPSVWFYIKAKESIYLRFDENRGSIQLFYNGEQVDTGNKTFFERTFQ